MPKVVVVGATLKCSHGGMVTLTSGNAKLKVDGKAVIVSGNEVGISFAAGSLMCPWTQPPPAPPKTPAPCSSTQAALPGGVSTRLKVDGLGVLLDTATGPAINPFDLSATWEVFDPGQTKLEEK